MGRSFEARIKRAAHKVIRRERELETALESYRKLVHEAFRKGVEVPKTVLTNPLFVINRQVGRSLWPGKGGPSSKAKR